MAEVTAMATAGAMVEVTAIDPLFPSGATSALPIIGALACGLLFRRSMPQSRGARLQAKLNGLNSCYRITNRCLTMRCKSSGAARKRMVRARPPPLGARSETKRFLSVRNRRMRPVDLKYRALERAYDEGNQSFRVTLIRRATRCLERVAVARFRFS
jgi:hypothetical protein